MRYCHPCFPESGLGDTTPLPTEHCFTCQELGMHFGRSLAMWEKGPRPQKPGSLDPVYLVVYLRRFKCTLGSTAGTPSAQYKKQNW